MIDHIVFDVEIAKTVEEVGGWDNTERMGVGVACLWQYRDQRMRVYGPDELPALRDRLLAADRVSSFNGFRFDCPVVWGVSKLDWKPGHSVYDAILPKTDDMLRRIWRALGLNPDVFSRSHAGWGLDAVAGDTLRAGKIGHGADAPKWYQSGQICRVANYCADDTCLERDLTDFVDRYGYVVNGGRILRLPAWEPEARAA